jgi:hypothetical protein
MMRCSDPCRWIYQGTGLRPLDALAVSVLNGLTSILKGDGPITKGRRTSSTHFCGRF